MHRARSLLVGLVLVLSTATPVTAAVTPPDATRPASAPQIAAPLVQISAGYYHTCALDSAGTITCWGFGGDGATTVPAGTYTAVSAGQEFTCAIRTDRTLACWGLNDLGQTSAPAGTYRSVSAGGNHACAIRDDWGPSAGSIVCWGLNAYGQATSPSDLWTAVAAGFRHTCAIRSDTGVYCWGSNDDGQAPPASVTGSFSALGAGGWHTCGIETGNTISCWGYDGDGQTEAPAGTFTALAVGFSHNCAIRSTGALVCWGYNGDGESSPPSGTFTAVSAGLGHTCGIQGGLALCWGVNYDNQAMPYPPAATTYVPVTPTRLLDTRTGNGLSGAFVSGIPRTFAVAGRTPIPTNAVAITGNLTVTGQTGGGYASLGPVSTATPTTSTLNFPLGDNRANNVTVTLGVGGKLSAVYKSGAGKTAHLLLDVTGYSLANTTGATYNSVAPVRLLDTRSGNGLSGAFVSGVPRTWHIAGRGGIPTGATAITGNLTVTGQTGGGYASLGPLAMAAPKTSTLNFPVGDNRANGITVKLASDGTLSAAYLGPRDATAHLILDVTGYYVADLTGARFYPLEPDRLLDTRVKIGLETPLAANIARTLEAGGHVGVPTDATAVTGNLTVVGQTKTGYVSMTQTATNTPSTSTLNFPVGDIRANGVTGSLAAGGTVGLVYRAVAPATTNLLLDITGYFK